MTINSETLINLFYSRGIYFLFEHWQEDRKNIYSKAKYATEEEFMKGAGKILTPDELVKLKNGDSIKIERDDGTALFFKFVNNP